MGCSGSKARVAAEAGVAEVARLSNEARALEKPLVKTAEELTAEAELAELRRLTAEQEAAAAEAAQRMKKSMGLDDDGSGPRISVHVPEMVDYYGTKTSDNVQKRSSDDAVKESPKRNLILELPFRCRMGRYFPHVRDFVDTHGETLYARTNSHSSSLKHR